MNTFTGTKSEFMCTLLCHNWLILGGYTTCKIKTYVTRFWENDPNRTSVKIKLTPPMDSFTITLLVQTLSITQTTEGWF